MKLKAKVLFEGTAEGPALVLSEALSFWGGLDPATGLIIDQRHPQAGASVADKVLAIPALRGSSGSAGSLAEAFKNGHGPAALVLGEADTAPIAAALVVQHLYGRQIPILEVPPEEIENIETGAWISIGAEGAIETAA